MQVILKDSEYQTKDIYFIDGSKTLIIMFGGTGDLYWIINNINYNKNEEFSHDYFEITKENYQVYLLFEKLINDIKNVNIFGREEIEFPPYAKTDEDKEEYLERLELDKKRYRIFNDAYYNDLFDEEANTITWVSDEIGFEIANKVQIKKAGDRFIINFFTQSYIEGYEREDNMLGIIGIRFRNSGSRYDPFNLIFMRMFNELQRVDDINDYGHQIHIEEYLYQQEQVKKFMR